MASRPPDPPGIPPEWLHPPSLKAASELQRRMAGRVLDDDAFGPVRCLGGADVSQNRWDPEKMIHAAIVVLDLPTLRLAASAGTTARARFPYVPGFLGFREAPSLVEAWRALPAPPDLLFVDGHGLSHPRGLGIATHLGVLLDRPTIGVAKTILIGSPAGPLGPEPGDRTPLVWQGRTIGMVVRTKRRANPLYVSVGHRVALGTAVEWVLRTARGYRLPEPIRQAHLAANALRRGFPATGKGS
ncbi:MAG TPA: deoxyribonuclease V [Alphaproteobacteria bacterium]|nr:deoxyribonuclease V [Alphaproteobacteria bacterium]